MSGEAGLIFKGSGFYTTDYRSEGYKQAAKKEADGAHQKEAPAKTEPKSATATATTAPKAGKD
jgi:predicted nucleic acid-binding Zn ribbon protein